VFGRRTAKKSEPVVVETSPKPGGKGRPTPKRREAEMARKKRVAPPRNRKEAAALQRERMRAEREKRVSAMRTGDERYLPARDRGPVRRFVRDFVDSRRSVGEFLLPLLVTILVLSFLGETQVWARSATATLWLMMIVLTTLGPAAEGPLPRHLHARCQAVRAAAEHPDALPAHAQAAGQGRREAARALPLTRRPGGCRRECCRRVGAWSSATSARAV
jgi:hypothetical protein